LEALYEFKNDEDPENKLTIVTRKGFWPKTDELGRHRTLQSRAYAERATGDYLWQVDIDEFYRNEDMQKILNILTENISISAITFPTITFWGREDIACDSWALRRGDKYYHRLFKWGKGYKYLTHEPPTIINEMGQDLRDIHWLKGEDLAKRNIYMYHYSLLFPWQVEQKVKVYQQEKPDFYSHIAQWAKDNYFQIKNPYRVHNLYAYPSWLLRFKGQPPEQISRMMKDIEQGVVKQTLRPTDDIEQVFNKHFYSKGIIFFLLVGYYINANFENITLQIRIHLGRLKRQVLGFRKLNKEH